MKGQYKAECHDEGSDSASRKRMQELLKAIVAGRHNPRHVLITDH
jgi:hypothetical protein